MLRTFAAISTLCVALLTCATLVGAQTWTPLTHQPTFDASTALLLTDGTVMVQSEESGTWWRLTPDNTGSYINGTWSQLASMPSGYGPLYYASAVLPDGRVVVEGGEYNVNQGEVETTLGAIYNPAANAWTAIAPPSGWGAIGDGQSAVLSSGTFMLGNCGVTGSICSPGQTQQALLNASSLTWTITGSGKADQNSEEGWTLLPSGNVLTVDVWNGTESELYNPSTGSWSLAGSTVVQLVNTSCSEIGPAVLRPNGTVFATGATSNNAIYNTTTGTWSAGPSFPSGYGIADGPAALLPDGNVLVQAAPISPCYTAGSEFYEFNGTSLTSVPGPPNAPSDPSYVGRMLVLPAGQILFTDATASVEIYTPAGTYSSAWQPTITSFPSTVIAGDTGYSISGTQFNGLSQGAMYGDDAQMATNYPLVRITNTSTGHVFYAKTHGHSTMAVATGAATVSTEFDVPSTIETGSSTLVVVANGIPSNPVSINVQGAQTASLAIDVQTSGDHSAQPPSTTLSTPTFSTSSGNELLLAFISAGHASGTTVTSVSGGGLTWQLVLRTDPNAGTAEIWRAFATSKIINATVIATLNQQAYGSITVLTFTGADSTGTNGSGAIGATSSAWNSTSSQNASLTTTRNNSWTFAAGSVTNFLTGRTPGAGQSLVHELTASPEGGSGGTYWVQKENGPTPTSGTNVTMTDTPSNGETYNGYPWNLSLVEVLPSLQ